MSTETEPVDLGPEKPTSITFIALKTYLQNLYRSENSVVASTSYEMREKFGRLGMISTIYEEVKNWEGEEKSEPKRASEESNSEET